MRRLFSAALALAVLSALLLTWHELNKRHIQNLEGHFTLETRRLTTKIGERMAAYAQILRAGAGLFAASREVSRQEWQRFIEALALGQAYRGIQGVGFALYLPRERLAGHEQAVRAEGFPDYAVVPAGTRADYSSIVYLEPFDARNLRAFGYDMFSEPVRHVAMAQARDTGKVAFSGKVTLVQETGEQAQAGFLAYHPVYRGEHPPETVETRRAALHGWVYSPYRANDLLDPILQDELGAIRLEIFDGQRPDPASLLYDSDSRAGEEVVAAPAAAFVSTLPFELEGRRWTLRYTARPAFVSATKFEPPWVEMTAIGLIALLLFGMTSAFFNTRRRAERIAAELVDSLRESEARRQAMLEEMPVGLCLVEASGQISFRNRRFVELFGHDAHSVPSLAQWWQAAYPDPDYRAQVRAPWNAALARAGETGRDIAPIEYRVTARDGQVRDILISGITLGTQFLATFVDQTERKQHEIQLRQAHAAAEAASRAKSAFVANMSHEIRTPMNAVLGLLQLLRHTPLSPRQLDYTCKAQAAAQSLLAILNDILDFSKVEAGKLTLDNAAFRLDELLRNLSVILSAALGEKPVEILFQIDPPVPRALCGDALRLQQVLLNLTGNAIKFTEAGEVVVGLRVLEGTPSRARIAFSVRDTGIGIPPDRLAAVFEGFAQAETSTARRYGGTGLGLPISQRLVRLMGGELAVDSQPGAGSHFHFVLDFARDEACQALEREARPVAEPAFLARVLRVLVVDDNRAARDVLGAMVSAFGWQVETAAGGVQALALIAQASQAGRPFDVVCVDWSMPGLDGWETVLRMRAQCPAPRVPVILMVTVHGRDVLAERLGTAADPCDAYLVKPVTPSMLFDAIALATGGRSVAGEGDPPATAHRPLAGMRLLLVEDHPLNQQVASELLAQAGAQVQIAGDGRQCLACVERTWPPFDAVLMDIQMPEMDGYETTRRLRAGGHATLPIIAMTANVLPADRMACLAAGMDEHVGKPIDLVELVKVLARYARSGSAPADLPGPCPPADPAVDPVALPALPEGFGLSEALARLGGNRPLLATLIRRFPGDQAAAFERLAAALAQGQSVEAAREVHTVKGLLATLGAESLAREAAGVEQRIRAGEEGKALAGALAGLRGGVEAALSGLGALADALDPP